MCYIRIVKIVSKSSLNNLKLLIIFIFSFIAQQRKSLVLLLE